MNTQTFAREYRYYVMKITDTKAALTQTEQEILDLLIDKVRRSRAHNGKTPLQGVFVENDWPEHDAVWTAIELRTLREQREPQQAAWAKPYSLKVSERLVTGTGSAEAKAHVAAHSGTFTNMDGSHLVWPDLECVHDWITEIQDSHRTCVYCKKSEPMEQPA
jgi:hypothetical protein